MMLYAVNLLMAIVWAAVTGSASLHNLIFGFVLSTLALGLIREQINGTGYITRSLRVASLLWLFLVELAKSALKVAIMVVKPNLGSSRAFCLSAHRHPRFRDHAARQPDHTDAGHALGRRF